MSEQPETRTTVFRAGDTVAGRFRVVSFLGRGGMGEVYEADDVVLSERVALKTVALSKSNDPAALDRFRQEIQAARRVTHSNICRVHDVFRHGSDADELWFLSMEMLQGETLSERLHRDQPVTRRHSLYIAKQIAAALKAIHAVQIVHRDLKPSNVMLVPDSTDPSGVRVVVMDFGIAGWSSDGITTTRKTATGQLLGTPGYLAPEQLEGGAIGGWTDIYAFGIIFFELLCRRLPFGGDTPIASALRRLTTPPMRPHDIVPDIPPRWESLILRCLNRNPAQRFPSGEALVNALDGLSAEKTAVFLQSRKAGAWLIAAVGALLVSASVFMVWSRYGRATLTTEPENPTFSTGTDKPTVPPRTGEPSATTRAADLPKPSPDKPLLQTRYEQEIVPECRRIVTGQYPFDRTSQTEVRLADFSRLFAYGGIYDSFFMDEMMNLVDRSATPWRWASSADKGWQGNSAAVLKQFEIAGIIRTAFFPPRATMPSLRFSLTVEDLDIGASRFTLDIDGQETSFSHFISRSVSMTWPGPESSAAIATFVEFDRDPRADREIAMNARLKTRTIARQGQWAWFRLLDVAGVQAEGSSRFRLVFQDGGHRASVMLDALTIDNPYTGALRQFRCD